jgi:hypothetical protein
MEAAHDLAAQEKENLAGNVMESLGDSSDGVDEGGSPSESQEQSGSSDPLYVQKRLKQQKRAHDREMRALHAKIEAMQPSYSQSDYSQNEQPQHQNQGSGSIDEHVARAVHLALQHKEMEERKAHEAESAAHVHRQYQELNKHLDGVSEKYDDFDDVVRGEHTPYTSHMRDASLLLPQTGAGSAGEVLYKLGKPENRAELDRIRMLHPLEQARELNKLSHALIKSEHSKGTQAHQPMMGNIKSNPAINSSNAVTEQTLPADIRARMKAGKFK